MGFVSESVPISIPFAKKWKKNPETWRRTTRHRTSIMTSIVRCFTPYNPLDQPPVRKDCTSGLNVSYFLERMAVHAPSYLRVPVQIVNMVNTNFSPSRSQNLKILEHSDAWYLGIRVFQYFQVL
jgi:hypothetical protein